VALENLPRDPREAMRILGEELLVLEAEQSAHGWRHMTVVLGDIESAEDEARWLAFEHGARQLLDGHRHWWRSGHEWVSVAVGPPDAQAVVIALGELGQAVGAFEVRERIA